MKTYGISSHDDKVEDYGEYKTKQFDKANDKLSSLLNSIGSSSLKDKDKKELLSDIIRRVANTTI